MKLNQTAMKKLVANGNVHFNSLYYPGDHNNYICDTFDTFSQKNSNNLLGLINNNSGKIPVL